MVRIVTKAESASPCKAKCADCLSCQTCSESRCRICRKEGAKGRPCELGPFLTHGEYLAWKRKKYGLEGANP